MKKLLFTIILAVSYIIYINANNIIYLNNYIINNFEDSIEYDFLVEQGRYNFRQILELNDKNPSMSDDIFVIHLAVPPGDNYVGLHKINQSQYVLPSYLTGLNNELRQMNDHPNMTSQNVKAYIVVVDKGYLKIANNGPLSQVPWETIKNRFSIRSSTGSTDGLINKKALENTNAFLKRRSELCYDILNGGTATVPPLTSIGTQPKKIMLLDYKMKFLVLNDPTKSSVNINNLNSESYIAEYNGSSDYHIQSFYISGITGQARTDLSNFIKNVINSESKLHDEYQFVGAVKSYFINNQQPVEVNGIPIPIPTGSEIFTHLATRPLTPGPLMEIPTNVSDISIHDFCNLLTAAQKAEIVTSLNRTLFDMSNAKKVSLDFYITDNLAYTNWSDPVNGFTGPDLQAYLADPNLMSNNNDKARLLIHLHFDSNAGTLTPNIKVNGKLVELIPNVDLDPMKVLYRDAIYHSIDPNANLDIIRLAVFGTCKAVAGVTNIIANALTLIDTVPEKYWNKGLGAGYDPFWAESVGYILNHTSPITAANYTVIGQNLSYQDMTVANFAFICGAWKGLATYAEDLLHIGQFLSDFILYEEKRTELWNGLKDINFIEAGKKFIDSFCDDYCQNGNIYQKSYSAGNATIKAVATVIDIVLAVKGGASAVSKLSAGLKKLPSLTQKMIDNILEFQKYLSKHRIEVILVDGVKAMRICKNASYDALGFKQESYKPGELLNLKDNFELKFEYKPNVQNYFNASLLTSNVFLLPPVCKFLFVMLPNGSFKLALGEFDFTYTVSDLSSKVKMNMKFADNADDMKLIKLTESGTEIPMPSIGYFGLSISDFEVYKIGTGASTIVCKKLLTILDEFSSTSRIYLRALSNSTLFNLLARCNKYPKLKTLLINEDDLVHYLTKHKDGVPAMSQAKIDKVETLIQEELTKPFHAIDNPNGLTPDEFDALRELTEHAQTSAKFQNIKNIGAALEDYATPSNISGKVPQSVQTKITGGVDPASSVYSYKSQFQIENATGTAYTIPDNAVIHRTGAQGPHELTIFECKANTAGFTDVQKTELINKLNALPPGDNLTMKLTYTGKGKEIIDKLYPAGNAPLQNNAIELIINKQRYYKVTGQVNPATEVLEVNTFDVKLL